MTDYVNVRNTESGRVGAVPRSYFENPVLNKGVLVEVAHDAKPYIKELYKPRTAEAFLEEKSSKRITEPAIDPAEQSLEDEPDTDKKDN